MCDTMMSTFLCRGAQIDVNNSEIHMLQFGLTNQGIVTVLFDLKTLDRLTNYAVL